MQVMKISTQDFTEALRRNEQRLYLHTNPNDTFTYFWKARDGYIQLQIVDE